MRKNYKQRDKGPQILANNRIQAEKVRVNFSNGESKIMSKQEAINQARHQGLDLVLIAERADPPVCKIIELNKYLYGLKQKEKKAVELEKKLEEENKKAMEEAKKLKSKEAKLKDKEIAEALELPPIKYHCSVLAEATIKGAIEDWEEKKNGRDTRNI